MKKALLIFISTIILFSSVACNAASVENTSTASNSEISNQEQEKAESAVEENGDASDGSASNNGASEEDPSKLEYEWYDREQLDKWIEKCISSFKEEPCSDNKHFYHYYSMPSSFIEGYITNEVNEKYKSMCWSCWQKLINNK